MFNITHKWRRPRRCLSAPSPCCPITSSHPITGDGDMGLWSRLSALGPPPHLQEEPPCQLPPTRVNTVCFVLFIIFFSMKHSFILHWANSERVAPLMSQCCDLYRYMVRTHHNAKWVFSCQVSQSELKVWPNTSMVLWYAMLTVSCQFSILIMNLCKQLF